MSEDQRFPIGEFDLENALRERGRSTRIGTIAGLPAAIANAVKGLDDVQMAEPYRPGGWTISQVVHHLADSHMNSFIRFKLALTEEKPTIRAYFEDRWAELPDSKLDILPSMNILNGIHARWCDMLNAMSHSDFERTLDHPESGTWNLDGMLALYDWHSRHHTAHITNLRERMNW